MKDLAPAFVITPFLVLFPIWGSMSGEQGSAITATGLRVGDGVLSRKRRYVVFPEGSVLSVALCVSPTAITGAGGIFTSGMAWAISYDLPNETVHSKEAVPGELHRHKRDLYMRMEKLVETSGLNGRSCLLRTICETNERIVPRQSVLGEILRTVFAYPARETTSFFQRENDGRDYAFAHRAGESGESCEALFPCPVSFLQLALQLGKH